MRRAMVAADVVGLGAAFVAASAFAASPAPSVDQISGAAETLLFVLTLPGWVLLAKIYGLYDGDVDRNDHSTIDDVVGVFHVVTLGAWAGFAAGWLSGLATPTPTKTVSFWALAIVACVGLRVAARSWCRRRSAFVQNTVIVGAGDVGQLLARKMLRHPEYGVRLLGFIDVDPKPRRADLAPVPILGSLDQLPAIARDLDVERVIIAFSSQRHDDLLRLARSTNELDIQVDVVPRLFEMIGTNVSLHDVEGMALLALPRTRLSWSSSAVKRLLDVTLACAGLVMLAPMAVAVAFAIKRDSPGPVFFRQPRVGAGNRVFSILKFRTMHADADARKEDVLTLNKHLMNGEDPRMFKAPDDPRVTRIGRFLRRTSIDELPQLLNVVRGDMSLVGPRPLVLDEDLHVSDWGRERLTLRPGITGLWQVLGRDNIPFDEMVRLDYLYVTSWSLRNDLRLLTRTLPAVVRQRRRNV